MPCVDVVVSCPLLDSFRVQQVAGMFDVPLSERCREQFSVELPDETEPWEIGLIVGPSGSGKSSVAAETFGNRLYRGKAWAKDKAVIDCFGELPLRQTVRLLTAVGFSSPPSWVKPYHVLSCGERFRCDLARALGSAGAQPEAFSDGARRSTQPHLVVFDEFTSVVDRNVAKACSTAIAKGIRQGNFACRFIAVTCHYDVAEWLEADWVLDMATRRLDRRRLRRPPIRLEISNCRRAAWQLFARHHYLSGALAPGARCYLATWEGEPVAFCATIPVIATKNHRRFTRIVTLPDYQGMGIGMKVMSAVASLHRREGHRISVTSSHPALIHHCQHSRVWNTVRVTKAGDRLRGRTSFSEYRNSAGRAVVSFEFSGD